MAKRALAPLVLLLAACLARRPFERPAPGMTLRRAGPERSVVPYDDPRAAAKRVLVERINRDRERHGAPRLEYEHRAALVGDEFCLDAALAGTTGHWDAAGRAPYLRWGLAGGVDYHAENVVAYTFGSGAVQHPLEELMLEAHQGMMAERAPRDGHRRTILDPRFTHVGIGVAEAVGQFRMAQEFTRVALEWLEVPHAPLAAGGLAYVAGRPLPGLWIGRVEILYEPRPPALLEPRLGGYAYPPSIRTLRPVLGGAFAYADRSRGDFAVRRDGRFSLTFPLDQGPGDYYVVCHVGARPPSRESPAPATAALVVALP
jgi:uncharacterized protein YkwD